MVMYKKSLGDMIQVDGCEWNIDGDASLTDAYMDLWLPRNAFNVVKELQL